MKLLQAAFADKHSTYALLRRLLVDEALGHWPRYAFAVVLMGVVATYWVSASPVLPFYGVSLAQSWFTKIFPPVHLFEFLGGMLTAQLLLAGRRIRIGGVLPGLVVAAIGFVIEAKVPLLYSFGAVTILPAAFLIAEFLKIVEP